MKSARLVAIVCASLAILLGLMMLPAPMPAAVKVTFIQTVLTTFLFIGAAIIFLLAGKGFQKHLQLAYRLICISMLLMAVGNIHYAVLGTIGAFNSPWVLYGGGDIPFLLMILFAYLGVRILTLTVGTQSSLTKLPVAFGWMLGLGLAALLLPATVPPPINGFDYLRIVKVVEAVSVIVTLILIVKSLQVVSVLYKPALRRFLWFYVALAVAGVAAVIAYLYVPADSWYGSFGIGVVPYVLGGVLGTTAALQFVRLAHTEKLVVQTPVARGRQTSIDIVTFLASFASRPALIDPILDPLRDLTSVREQSQHLDDTEQRQLAAVYAELEDYLVENEPARRYKRDDLRQMIDIRFRASVDEPVFWNGFDALRPRTMDVK